jgi:hypothetical protein
MRVVLKIWSGNPNWDGGCDYAMVDLTPEVAALALGPDRYGAGAAGDRPGAE